MVQIEKKILCTSISSSRSVGEGGAHPELYINSHTLPQLATRFLPDKGSAPKHCSNNVFLKVMTTCVSLCRSMDLLATRPKCLSVLMPNQSSVCHQACHLCFVVMLSLTNSNSRNYWCFYATLKFSISRWSHPMKVLVLSTHYQG